jgi:hypothetical protein
MSNNNQDDDKEVYTSMGSSSGTQQWSRVPRNQPVQNQQYRAPANQMAGIGGFDSIHAPIRFFGFDLKLYHLLILAALGFYLWGLPGVIGVGILYWVSNSFQQQAPPAAQAPAAGAPPREEERGFRPINEPRREYTPSQQPNPSGPPRFPGSGNSLK